MVKKPKKAKSPEKKRITRTVKAIAEKKRLKPLLEKRKAEAQEKILLENIFHTLIITGRPREGIRQLPDLESFQDPDGLDRFIYADPKGGSNLLHIGYVNIKEHSGAGSFLINKRRNGENEEFKERLMNKVRSNEPITTITIHPIIWHFDKKLFPGKGIADKAISQIVGDVEKLLKRKRSNRPGWLFVEAREAGTQEYLRNNEFKPLKSATEKEAYWLKRVIR